MNPIKKLAALLTFALISVEAFGQASLLPNAKQTFVDINGAPLASGTVDLYVPNTTTRKNSWVNSTETGLNTNPVQLDAAGRAIIFGQGSYRQIVKDSAGVTQWDALTTAPSASAASVLLTDAAPVGTMLPYSGFVLPTNYLWAYGQALNRVTYAALMAATTLAQTATSTTSSTTIAGLADTTQIRIGAPIEGTCLSAGTTVATIAGAASITVSAVATSTGACTVTVFPYGNGDGTTTFNAPDMRGRNPTGRDNIGGTAASTLTTAFYGANPDGLGQAGGAQSKVLVTGNLPAYTPAGTIAVSAHSHFISNTDALSTGAPSLTNTTYAAVSNLLSTQSINYALGGSATIATIGLTSTTTSTATFTGTAQGGTATAFSLIQPSITINYIIKYQASDPSGSGGVVSLGGMTGDILCGLGLTCSAGTISATSSGLGDVVGPASSVAGQVAIFANTTGKLLAAANPSGNTATFATTTGVLTATQCAIWDASGNLTSGACGGGGGGSGTVTSVATSGPITGGTITTTGTIACATCVTSAAALTANQLLIGGGLQAAVALGSAGTATTLLHGGTPPSFSAVVSADLNITPTACLNQFVTAISATAVGTCTLASLTGSQFANQGTTTTLLHGNAVGNQTYGPVVSADLNITTTTCSANNFVSSISIGAVGTCSAAAGGITGLANPTASVGLTAVNGSATTAMRSDGAPALSQSIVPTWTGAHTFNATITAAAANFSGIVAHPAGSAGAPSIHFGDATTGLYRVGLNDIGVSASGTKVLDISASGLGVTGDVGSSNRFINSQTIGYTGFDSLTGVGLAVSLTGRLYANSAISLEWTQNLITANASLVAASTLYANAARTIASAATPTWADFGVPARTTTFSGSTNITGLIGKSQFEIPTLTASAAAISIAKAATIRIMGAPTTSASGGFTPTITAAYALDVEAGRSLFEGGFTVTGDSAIYNIARTIASTASMVWNDIEVSPTTLTLTGTTAVTTDIAKVAMFGGTVAQSGAGTVTVTQAETLYVGIPAAGTDVTLSNIFSAFLDGNIRLPTSSYINFSGTSGSGGCGFRDNAGTMQVANCSAAGTWTNFSASAQGQVMYVGSSAVVGAGTTFTSPITGAGSATEANVSWVITRAGTLRKLYARLFTAQSGTGTCDITVRINGVDTTITINIPLNQGSATSVSDTTHTVAVSEGDRLTVKWVQNTGGNSAAMNLSLQLD